MLVVSVHAAQPTVPTSSHFTRALRTWLDAADAADAATTADAADAAMDASDASAAPLATLPERQAEAVLLCRLLWERCGEAECNIDADQVGNLLTVALRAGVPGLVQDVLQHIVIPDGWTPLEEVMEAPFVDWVVRAWGTIGSKAQGMLGRVIARRAVKSAPC